MSDCRSEHCVTCSDEGLPMRVVEPGIEALCRGEAGDELLVMTDLVGPVTVGETLLVHAGVALTRVRG